MMRRLWKVLTVLAVLSAALVAAGVAVLKSMDFNQYRELIADEVKSVTGRELAIAGDLSLNLSFNPAIAVEGVTFANAAWGSVPVMAKLKRLEVEVQLLPLLSGDIRVNRIVLIGLDALLETDAKGQGNWQFAAPDEAETEKVAGPLPVVKNVLIQDISLTYRDGQSREETVFGLDRLVIGSVGLESPLELELAGAYNGAGFEAAGRLGSVKQLTEGGAPFPVDLKALGLGASVSVKGAIARPLDGTGLDLVVAADVRDLAAISKAMNLDLPKLPPIYFDARLGDPKGGYAIDGIQVKIGNSDLSGKATVALAGKRPSVDVRLASKLLDLDELLGSGEKKSAELAAKPGKGKQARVFPADPLPLDGLRAVDADVALKAARLLLPGGIAASNAEVALSLKDGKLSAIRSADLAGGKVSGKAFLDGSGGAAALNFCINAKGVGLGRLLKEARITDEVLGGGIDAMIDLRGRGATVRGLMASLTGEVRVEVGAGKIKNSAIDWAGADMLTQVAGALNPFGTKEEYTVLKCGVVRFLVKDGLATSDKGVAIETDKMVVVGSGTVNLKTEELDFTVKPGAREGLGLSLGSVVSMVRVKGTLAEPSVGLDELETVKSALKVGTAIATGGLSLLGEALFEKDGEDVQPCLAALGKAPPKSATTEERKKPEGVEGVVKDLGDGISGALKGLFGGK